MYWVAFVDAMTMLTMVTMDTMDDISCITYWRQSSCQIFNNICDAWLIITGDDDGVDDGNMYYIYVNIIKFITDEFIINFWTGPSFFFVLRCHKMDYGLLIGSNI